MEALHPGEFARIYRHNHGAVLASARRVLRDVEDAEEVAQDVFMSLWRQPGRFDASRAPLRTYLTLMARSRALDAYRSRASAARAAERLRQSSAVAHPLAEGPHERIERAERLRTVTKAVSELPPPQREAFALAHWQGLSAREIAARAGVPDGTARSRIRLARARVRRELPAS